MEQMRERVKAAMVSYAFQECQPDKGDIFGWFDDRADEIADAALSLMQPEIDRRVEEERVKLLERLREPSRAMQIAGVEASPWSEPRQLSCGQWGRESFNTDECAAIWQARLAQYEKDNSHEQG